MRERSAIAARHLAGEGIEVGALHLPLPVPLGARVRYVDRMTADDLRRHYPELAAYPLVEVDVVDDGETLASFADGSLDFVVANHFLEHTEDPIGTLRNHLRVLRPGGALYLAVPDKRSTFDVDRPVTPLEHVVADHESGPQASRHAHYEEWARLVDRVPEESAAQRAAELDEQGYSIHFHVWTPAAFLELLEHCRTQLGLPFEVADHRELPGELVVVLRRSA